MSAPRAKSHSSRDSDVSSMTKGSDATSKLSNPNGGGARLRCQCCSLPFLVLNTILNVAILCTVTLSVWLVTFSGARHSTQVLADSVQQELMDATRQQIVPYFSAAEQETLVMAAAVRNSPGLIGTNKALTDPVCTSFLYLAMYFINSSSNRLGMGIHRHVYNPSVNQFYQIQNCDIQKTTLTWGISRTLNATTNFPNATAGDNPMRVIHSIPNTVWSLPVATSPQNIYRTFAENKIRGLWSLDGLTMMSTVTGRGATPDELPRMTDGAVWEGNAYFETTGRPTYTVYRWILYGDNSGYITTGATSDFLQLTSLLRKAVSGKQRMWLTLQRPDGKLLGISHGKTWSHSDLPASRWAESNHSFYSPLNSTDAIIAEAAQQIYETHGRTWDVPDFRETLRVAGEKWILLTSGMPEHGRRLRLWLLQDYDSLLGELDRSLRRSIIIFAVLFVVGVAAVVVLSIVVTLPLRTLQKGINLVRDMEFGVVKRQFRDHSVVREVRQLQRAFSTMVVTLESFSCYVPLGVVKKIIRRGRLPKLEMEERCLTVAFMDIKGFTDLSAEMPPDEVMLLLSETLTMLSSWVITHAGIVDKYIGDCVMALWNAPDNTEEHEAKACAAAVSCLSGLESLTTRLRSLGLPSVAFRIGIATGLARIGNVGCRERFNYTAIGDTVNIAARLEAANKHYGTTILVTAAVQQACEDQFAFLNLGPLAVVGRREPVHVYELRGPADAPEGGAKAAQQWNTAMKLYHARNFLQAREVFRSVERTYTANLFASRCDAYIKNPPSENWTGAEVQVAK